MKALVLITMMPFAALEPAVPTAEQFISEYFGVETALLDQELVQFKVQMTNAIMSEDVSKYAECAVAQDTLIRGWGFARHVRTNVNEEGGVWLADAVYTISPALPRGSRKIDAEVVTAACVEKGIPTV
jgi:hypothetical protein